MKKMRFAHLAGIALVSGVLLIKPTYGQYPPPPRPGYEDYSYLSPGERQEYFNAKQIVLAGSEDRRDEEEHIRKDLFKLRVGDLDWDDRRDLFKDIRKHSVKMNAAMLRVDPNIGPVLAKVDQHREAMIMQRRGVVVVPPPRPY